MLGAPKEKRTREKLGVEEAAGSFMNNRDRRYAPASSRAPGGYQQLATAQESRSSCT